MASGKSPGSGRRTRTPSPALKSRTITRFEDKRDMDVNNYTLEMRIKFCKDLRLLAEQIEETKQRILDKVETDVQERTAATQAENNQIQDKIDAVSADKSRVLDNVADLKERLRQLQADNKELAAKRPKVEAERSEAMERRRRVKEEEEDLREALAAAIKQGDDLRREIGSIEAGIVDLHRKAVIKGEECDTMNAQLPGLNAKIDEETQYFREDQMAYETWMREHGLDPTANWNIAGAEQIEALRALLRKEFSEALAQREAQIDAENSEEWNVKSDRLAGLIGEEADTRQAELEVKDKLADVITERDDLDAEIKALKAVIAQLRDAKCVDGEHGDKMARVQELQALLKELEDKLIPLRIRELELLIEYEKLRAAHANEKPILDGYLAEIDSVKAKRLKAEKEVVKALRACEAAALGHRANEDSLLGEITSKDDKINDLQKKVEELQREKLNADWISLQEEITEYRVILTGWGHEIPLTVPEPEPEPEPVVVEPPKPKPQKRPREDDVDAGDQDTDNCSIM